MQQKILFFLSLSQVLYIFDLIIHRQLQLPAFRLCLMKDLHKFLTCDRLFLD